MICYVAGPYAAATEAERGRNVGRALLLARAIFLRRGWSCIVPHPAIHAGTYGDDADPAQREAGTRATRDLVGAVAEAGGSMAALARDPSDDTPPGLRLLSPGTCQEAMDFFEATGRRAETRTWAEWRAVLDVDGLGLAGGWDALAEVGP